MTEVKFQPGPYGPDEFTASFNAQLNVVWLNICISVLLLWKKKSCYSDTCYGFRKSTACLILHSQYIVRKTKIWFQLLLDCEYFLWLFIRCGAPSVSWNFHSCPVYSKLCYVQASWLLKYLWISYHHHKKCWLDYTSHLHLKNILIYRLLFLPFCHGIGGFSKYPR